MIHEERDNEVRRDKVPVVSYVLTLLVELLTELLHILPPLLSGHYRLFLLAV